MQLSKRLQAIADFVTPGNRVADVGCDHAYVSIYLAQEKLSPKIIAMDINQGPVDRARENILKYGYASVVEVRKSDGINKLEPGEADTILLAGMGGLLMLQILKARPEVVATAEELVLQPQSDIHLVRDVLKDYGFLITAENMLTEDGKYYVCMKAKKAQGIPDPIPYELTKREHLYFGRLLLEHKNPVLREYLMHEKRQYEAIRQTLLSFPTEQSLQRQKEIIEELELIGQGLYYYEK